MSFGHFNENRKKIAAIERRAKAQSSLTQEVGWKQLADQLKNTILPRQAKLKDEKSLFNRSSLDKAEKPRDMLPLQAVGVETLARQQTDVKALAQKQSKIDATHAVRKKKFHRQQKWMEKACEGMEKAWGEKER